MLIELVKCRLLSSDGVEFFSTAQFQSFSNILYSRRLLNKMPLNASLNRNQKVSVFPNNPKNTHSLSIEIVRRHTLWVRGFKAWVMF